MGGEKTAAKNAEVKAFAHMAGDQITAKTVGGSQFVPMGGAKVFARFAAEMPYVCMVGSFTCAPFAAWNVPMTKRRVSARFVLMNANRSQSSVRMGTKKTDAANAKVNSCAHMANGSINARIVEGRLIVSMGDSEISAEIAVGCPYACINARFTGVLFAIGNVHMAKRVVDAKFVK